MTVFVKSAKKENRKKIENRKKVNQSQNRKTKVENRKTKIEIFFRVAEPVEFFSQRDKFLSFFLIQHRCNTVDATNSFFQSFRDEIFQKVLYLGIALAGQNSSLRDFAYSYVARDFYS